MNGERSSLKGRVRFFFFLEVEFMVLHGGFRLVQLEIYNQSGVVLCYPTVAALSTVLENDKCRVGDLLIFFPRNYPCQLITNCLMGMIYPSKPLYKIKGHGTIGLLTSVWIQGRIHVCVFCLLLFFLFFFPVLDQ